jgi:tRNA pseudouridine55 synthase
MKDFGLLIVDKPVGPTSHHIVSMVRRGTGIRKVGHAGTLDPRASGVLVLCLGAATRLSEFLSTSTKRYQATIRFGTSTRTYDSEGDILTQTGKIPTLKEIKEILPEFSGEIDQVPPPFSAIKVKGKKAYELARAGKELELAARKVTISDLKVHGFKSPDLSLEIECSAGTYIRSLAHDLGERLSSGAHLAALRRTKAGPFSLDEAIPMPKLEVGFLADKWERYVVPAVDALPEYSSVQLTEETLGEVKFGRRIPAEPGSPATAKALDLEGELVAILEYVDEGSLWHPRKVFSR